MGFQILPFISNLKEKKMIAPHFSKHHDIRFPFAHTFSIVARDPETGQMGVAVQSHWFSTGSLVTWGEAGVGVVATQSMVEVSYGPLGLDGMRRGDSPQSVLDDLLAKDDGRALRQVAMVNSDGFVAAHTGDRCIAEAGHEIGTQCSAQANMMLKNTVWHAMAEAFRSSKGELSEQLMVALEAAQNEGGDIRGKQSAAMLVVEGSKQPHPWQGITVDLRVDDHPEPLHELRRLLKVNKAYQSMNVGDACLADGKIDEAFNAYNLAASLAPEIMELPFWQAVTLAESGKVAESLPVFKKVFESDKNWNELLRRLPAAGLFKVSESDLQLILRQ
jgi:uncharacterized Ntn-hydrolase superfamily protein